MKIENQALIITAIIAVKSASLKMNARYIPNMSVMQYIENAGDNLLPPVEK
jgi:hypothetical protein